MGKKCTSHKGMDCECLGKNKHKDSGSMGHSEKHGASNSRADQNRSCPHGPSCNCSSCDCHKKGGNYGK